MKPTLVILAAGMGSRYGGLKQLDRLGPSGETILEYSIFDAIRAGFNKVVFIIRPDFEKEFRQQIGDIVARNVEVGYVFQTLDKLPEGWTPPAGRTKPWGTGHALLTSAPEVSAPFAILNADDYYGKEAFEVMAGFLSDVDPATPSYAMVGYQLANTLSEFGSVSRGVCEVDENGFLTKVVERTAISRTDNQIAFEEQGQRTVLADDTLVSMNFWGFTPGVFSLANGFFEQFLKEKGSQLSSEFYIPTLVTQALQTPGASLKVLRSEASWFGITYQEDKAMAVARFEELCRQGIYPDRLWT